MGLDRRRRPLVEREARLERLLAKARAGIQFSHHLAGDGAAIFAHACKLGESIEIAVTPTVAVAYAIVAAFLFGLSRYPAFEPAAEPIRDKAMASMPAE